MICALAESKDLKGCDMTAQEPTIHHDIETTELAKERNREAADRTLMAWIRTALSLIGFGFGIDAIVQSLEKTRLGSAPNLGLDARIVGISFIAIALFAVVVAMVQYRQEIKMLAAGDYRYQSSLPLALAVAGALGVVGLFAGISIVIRAITG